MKNIHLPTTVLFSALLFLSAILSSCAPSIVGQTGRTNGHKVSSFSANINVTRRMIDNRFGYGPVGLSEFQLKYQVGLGKQFDFAVGTNSVSGLFLESKLQIIGDQESIFATSLGMGLSTYYGFHSAIYFPVYISVHPNEHFAIYTSAKIAQNSSVLGDEDSRGTLTAALGAELFPSPRVSIILEANSGLERVWSESPTSIIGGGIGVNVRFGKKYKTGKYRGE